MGGLEHSLEPAQDHLEPPPPPPQPRRTLEALLGRCGPHLALDVLEQPARAVSKEQPERLVQPPPVEVRVEVAEAGRKAAPHLAIGRRVITAR